MTTRDMHTAICRLYKTCSDGCPLIYCGSANIPYSDVMNRKIRTAYERLFDTKIVSDDEIISLDEILSLLNE